MLGVVTIEVPSIGSDSECIPVSTSQSDHVSLAIAEWPGGSEFAQVPDSPALVLGVVASLVVDGGSVGVTSRGQAVSFWVSQVAAVAAHPLELLELAIKSSDSQSLAQSLVSVTGAWSDSDDPVSVVGHSDGSSSHVEDPDLISVFTSPVLEGDVSPGVASEVVSSFNDSLGSLQGSDDELDSVSQREVGSVADSTSLSEDSEFVSVLPASVFASSPHWSDVDIVEVSVVSQAVGGWVPEGSSPWVPSDLLVASEIGRAHV